MAITLDTAQQTAFTKDRLSDTTRTSVIDRWIYVFTAASIVAIVLTGFIPDSISMVARIQAGKGIPIPPILHVHAVLMGSFLLLLLGQTVLVAIGKRSWHMQAGIAATILVPAIVITGIILVPTYYHSIWNAAQTAPIAVKQKLQHSLSATENTLLLQLRAGFLFPIFMWIALRSRTRDSGLHKRLILLAITAVLSAAIARIHWLPTTLPKSALTLDLFTLLAFLPMFAWDLLRNRGLHRAYFIWAAFYFPVAAVIYVVWDTPIWHATARQIMGV